MTDRILTKNFKKLMTSAGRIQTAVKGKQFIIFDKDGNRVGFGTQYGNNSFSTVTKLGNAIDVQDYQVGQRLEHLFPGSTYAWN